MKRDYDLGTQGHWAVIFYTFCPKPAENPGEYLKYQRSLADKILKQGFKNKFGIEFDRNKVAKGEYGKPCWPGAGNAFFNISNTNGLLVCALSDSEIGVDGERIHAIRMPVVRRCCTPGEIAYVVGKTDSVENSIEELLEKEDCRKRILSRFFQIWTLKESYIKMTGEGLRFPLKQASFSIQEGKTDTQEIQCSQPGFFQQRQLGDYWISLCTRRKVEAVWEEVLPPDV